MDEKDVLLQFLDVLNKGTTVEQLLRQSADFLSRLFHAEQCALWVNDDNISQVPVSRSFVAVSRLVHVHVGLTNAFVLISNPAKDVLTAGLSEAKNIASTVAGFPIRVDKKHFATLVLSSQSIAQHVMLVSALLEKLSVALGRAQRYQMAERSAMTDALTGLYNKAYFLEALKNEIARSERSQRPVSLVVFDFDNFKEYNDTYGHPAGDRLLQQLGELVRQNVRSMDIPARYGGEEFAIILPETAHDEAFGFAERLRNVVFEKLSTTISIGIAVCLNSSLSSDSLLSQADKALYAAKRNGKNQTRSYVIIDKSLGVIDVQEASSFGKTG